MAALAKDVNIIKTLPKNLKGARRKKKIPVFRVPFAVSPYYYLHHVLPVLNKHLVVELVVSDGRCLQVIYCGCCDLLVIWQFCTVLFSHIIISLCRHGHHILFGI